MQEITKLTDKAKKIADTTLELARKSGDQEKIKLAEDFHELVTSVLDHFNQRKRSLYDKHRDISNASRRARRAEIEARKSKPRFGSRFSDYNGDE